MVALRQDLSLLPVEPDRYGQPAWVLHDPAQNRFFRFGATEIALLGQMTGAATADRGKMDPQQAEAFLAYLQQHNLLQGEGDANRQRLLKARQDQTPTWFTWLSRSYLSMRLPLVRPDVFLDATAAYLRWWFDPRMKYVMLVLGLIGLGMMLPRLDLFFATAIANFTPAGLLLYFGALALVKMVHELGHAYTAKHHGCRVPVMGVAFIVFWPILYTDTTDAWRLRSRKARVEIDVAGMKAELAMAILALLAWSVLPDGGLKDICFMISTTSLLLTFAVNLNPLMRFDGYYLISDWLGIENLQERATALARWRWREWLFDLGEPPPERPSTLMVGYAFGSWLYRLTLTLSIAAFVYSFFFKLLGALLFAWQLWLYAVKPMIKEVALLQPLWPRIRKRKRSWISLGVLLVLLSLLVLPVDRGLSLPAYLRSGEATVIYAPVAGRVNSLAAENGRKVSAGMPLLNIASEDAELELELAERNATVLRWQLEMQGLAPPWLKRSGVIEADLEATMARLHSLRRQAERSKLTAPHAAVVRDMLPDLAVGQWVGEGDALFTLIDGGEWQGVAFVSEADAERLRPGGEGYFVARDGSRPSIAVRIAGIDTTALREFDAPYLLSTHGGPLQARRKDNGIVEPLRAYYRVHLGLRPMDIEPGAFPHVLEGHVVLQAEGRSWLRHGLLRLLAQIREQAAI